MSPLCVLKTRLFFRQVSPVLRLPITAMQRHYSLDVAAPLLRTQGYVDGRWLPTASVFPVLDPATGQEIARVSDCGPAEAKLAVDAAYKAFHSWKLYSAKVTVLRSKNHQFKRNMLFIRQRSTKTLIHGIVSTDRIQTLIRLTHNSPDKHSI